MRQIHCGERAARAEIQRLLDHPQEANSLATRGRQLIAVKRTSHPENGETVIQCRLLLLLQVL